MSNFCCVNFVILCMRSNKPYPHNFVRIVDSNNKPVMIPLYVEYYPIVYAQKTKALIYNSVCFLVLFLLIRYFLLNFTYLSGIWTPLTAAIAASLLAPKFQVVNTAYGEKLFMKTLFTKGVKEIK